MEYGLEITDKEMVKLYSHLSSEYDHLDPDLKVFLHKLEKKMFSSMTITQIESHQKNVSGGA